jgi:hypothetical protein
MRFGKASLSQLILVLLLVLISPHSKAISFGRFQTFEELAFSAGKLKLAGDDYTGAAATINGGLQYGVLGVYVGLGPTLFIPDNRRNREAWTEYIGGFVMGGIMLRIPLKKGMIIAGNDFIVGVTYQPLVGYLIRVKTRHTGLFATATVRNSGDRYYGVGVRMTLE